MCGFRNDPGYTFAASFINYFYPCYPCNPWFNFFPPSAPRQDAEDALPAANFFRQVQ
jgi:hypothetical protein